MINKSDSASHSSDFVNHSYDYRPNWTPLGPITIINGQYASFHRAGAFAVHFAELAVDIFMKTCNQWLVYILVF